MNKASFLSRTFYWVDENRFYMLDLLFWGFWDIRFICNFGNFDGAVLLEYFDQRVGVLNV